MKNFVTTSHPPEAGLDPHDLSTGAIARIIHVPDRPQEQDFWNKFVRRIGMMTEDGNFVLFDTGEMVHPVKGLKFSLLENGQKIGIVHYYMK